MTDKKSTEGITLFFIFLEKYKNLAWVPCGKQSHCDRRPSP
jgi:hypothetical protein